MADISSIVQYIKEQLSSGYGEEQIREALASQGWSPEEIDQAFSMAAPEAPAVQEKPQVAAPQEKADRAAASGKRPAQDAGGFREDFILSVAGGILIVINSIMVSLGIGDLLGLFVSNINASVMEMIGVAAMSSDSVIINAIIGSFVVASSIIMYFMPGKARLTGIFVVILSLISILTGNGFLVGGVIAVIGGILAIMKKSHQPAK